MARQCTKPKRHRNLAWFKEKAMLVEALDSGVALDEGQMAFLADNGDTVTTGQASRELVTTTTFQTDDLDAFDSDYDEAPSASTILMAKLSLYDSDIMSEVLVDRNAKVADFQNQIHSLKLQVSATVESHKTLSTMVDTLKMESKVKEDKYLKEIIELEKKKKDLDNVVYKMVPSLYYGNTIVKQHDALSVIDTEETLELAEESRLKMHGKQNDPIAKEKKVNIAPINYAALNRMKTFEIKEKELLFENDRLLELINSQDLVHSAVNTLATIGCIVEQARESRPLDSKLDSASLRGNRANQREVTQRCSIKTFRGSSAKEFFGTEGGVGLLTWFESIESVLHIIKCPTESQVEFASTQPREDFKKLLMEEYCPDDEIQKLETEFWNHKMVESDIDGYTARFDELARLVPHMVTLEYQCVNRYIQGLVPEIKAHVTSSKPTSIQSAVSMANCLTTNGIKDRILKRKENVGNKKRLNEQNWNRGRDDRNKRQRTGRNFAITAPDQGQVQRQYAGQH
ncbi:putative reverse transcriptase domain-containing protein [Tanacetum coccineum]|uniref:Reverse transcriptase domain-containing protein n=1 Tax=Tanacetum coccineum TaxID=301880 RepID=A0ABQ5CE45_9ASTR